MTNLSGFPTKPLSLPYFPDWHLPSWPFACCPTFWKAPPFFSQLAFVIPMLWICSPRLAALSSLPFSGQPPLPTSPYFPSYWVPPVQRSFPLSHPTPSSIPHTPCSAHPAFLLS